mgnify:CR=1 FL=1
MRRAAANDPPADVAASHDAERFSLERLAAPLGHFQEIFVKVAAEDDEQLIITDVGSTNGTRVNGTRIVGPHRLVDGDEVRFGNTSTDPLTVDLRLESPKVLFPEGDQTGSSATSEPAGRTHSE